MTITLQVAQRFDSYSVGDQITLPDLAAQALLKAFPGRYQFAASAAGPSPGSPIVVPAQPNALIPVIGAPDPVFGASYGYALDLTSTPATLYHWTGTAWAIALQAGGGTPSPSVPTNTVLPAISGAAQVGQTLASSTGTWTGSPTSFACQWARNGTAISGATSATYAPASGDIGAVLTCAVTASNATGASQAAVWPATSAVIAAAVVAPGVIGAAPTLSAATSSTLTIAWLAPTTGGAPTDYLVQYRVTGATSWTAVDEASTALTATIAGLAAATSYDVQVIATNSAGQGAASPILTASTSAAAPVLQALGLASLAAVAGQLFAAAISGQAAGSTIAAASSDGTVLAVANGQVSGTFSAAGQPTVTLTETLAGATGSPKSTQLAVIVSATVVDRTATTDLSNPDRGLNPLI